MRRSSKKKEPTTIPFVTIRCVGGSRDGRTNVWAITCGCGHIFNPPTTMLATQLVKCPKCHYEQAINYNEL